jgi:hypothetical protein
VAPALEDPSGDDCRPLEVQIEGARKKVGDNAERGVTTEGRGLTA